MKNIFLFIVCISLHLGSLIAQDTKRAKTYFERAFYSDAIPLYEELAKNNRSKEVVQNLADCYYNTYQLPKAAKWYSYLTSVYGENLDEDYFFKYSQTLKSIGQYGEATQVLMDYYTKENQNSKVQELQSELNYLENVDAIGERFTMSSLALNTSYSEFGAAEIDSSLVYSAAKKKETPVIGKRYRWNNEGYLDLYKHPVSKLDVGDSISTGFSKQVNTKMHEGTFAVSNDGQTLYFTRNNFIRGKKRTDSKKVSNLNIYTANLIDGAWSDIKSASFNSDDFSNEHPTISKDGKTLYFASDRPGGKGSFDIYKVSIAYDGTLGEPINLGDIINTERKEQFPFIDTNDDLYFSSNGHPGFGLLDIYISKKENGTFQKPDNIGKPLNGGFDDFAYNLNTDGKTGYFSSNRPEGKGSDDIYALTVIKPLKIENCSQKIVGIVTDKITKKIIPFATVQLVDEEGKIVETLVTDKDASFQFSVTCQSTYRVDGKKDAYESDSKTVLTTKERNAEQQVNLILFSLADKQKAAEALALKKLEEEKAARAELIASEKLAKEERLKRSKEVEAKRVLAENIKKEKAEIEHKKNIEKIINKEPLIQRIGDKTVIKTEEIHFDYSLWYLRRESRERLGKVIEIMKSNPGMVVEIGTHTDIRGNAQYNRNLSQKRANSVKEFLIKNDIDTNQIIAKGYGESQPIVKCKTEEDCAEEDHEWNRRCEFVILKW